MTSHRHHRAEINGAGEVPRLPAPSSILGITPGVGTVHVTRSGPLGPLLGRLNRFPRRGNRHRVELEIHPDGPNREIWTRRFGDQGDAGWRPLRSAVFVEPGQGLCERWGPLTLVFARLEGSPTTCLRLRHSHIGSMRVARCWLAVDVECTPTVRACAHPKVSASRTTVTIAVIGGRAGTLTYTADVAPEVTP